MNIICVLVIKGKKITLLSLLFHYDHFSSQKSSLRITKLERKIYFKSQNNQAIKASLNYGKSAHTYGLWDGVGGLIRLIPKSFWFVMICSTGASWFLPTQGIVSWHVPIGAPMLARHSSAQRSLIHMARRVAWHLVKKVMMSMIKVASISDYDKVSPFLVPLWTLRQIWI